MLHLLLLHLLQRLRNNNNFYTVLEKPSGFLPMAFALQAFCLALPIAFFMLWPGINYIFLFTIVALACAVGRTKRSAIFTW